jgi:hypothetical protein
MAIPHVDIISRIIETPKDNRTISAKQFWKKEVSLFKKLYKTFPDVNFWLTLSLHDTPAKNGRILSLAFFLDNNNKTWFFILQRKWKLFHWSPTPIPNCKFIKNNPDSSNYPLSKKKTFRNFFD